MKKTDQFWSVFFITVHCYAQNNSIQSWALLLQVAVYIANSEKICEIADLKNSGKAVAYCKVSLPLLRYCRKRGKSNELKRGFDLTLFNNSER
jgi:formylmethanofuran dehydrogenase subunit A